MVNLTYSVFIDVLGYRSIVTDTTKTIKQKINILNSIYSNLATGLLDTIKEINSVIYDKIYIKSFSDCFYLESTNLLALLYSCNKIYNHAFGFYLNMPQDSAYTPLLRGGIVKDWTVRFKDLGAIVDDNQGTNPVGLGVARAYLTSEKSKLSGMRMIISKEVINDLSLIKYSNNGFDCLVQEYVFNNNPVYLFFEEIKTNEEGRLVDLYELIWAESVMSSCTYDYIEQLKNIRANFDSESLRHFKQTALVILKSLHISDCKEREQNIFEFKKYELENMIK